ncbi:MAG: Hsp20/alpha crystallin family protein [Candidatus Woesearchaeota archaeon]
MYWDPFEELERMHEEIDRLFKRSFMQFMPELYDRNLKDYRNLLGYDTMGSRDLITTDRTLSFRKPVCHLHETEKNIIAAFELPGVKKEDIELNVDDRSIELKVESKNEKKHEDDEKKVYGYTLQKFYRRVALPKEVDSSKAIAEYKDGVLRIEMPKKEQDSEKKRLQIK